MISNARDPGVDENDALAKDLVQVARLALAGGGHETSPALRRMARRYRESRPEIASALIERSRKVPSAPLAPR